MNKNVRKGFTLMELLIVIVVIAVLAAMMGLSSTEALSSAKAAMIIGNLRNLKIAGLQLYFSSMDNWHRNGIEPNISMLRKYVDSSDVDAEFSYSIEVSTSEPSSERRWYIMCDLGSAANEGELGRIKDKLARRAKLAGLIAGGSDGAAPDAADPPYKSPGQYVDMRIR